jgi:cold shock CspA family protein
MNPMLNGFVSEFDPADGVGIIEAEDGDIVFFNAGNLDVRQLSMLDVGSSVEFAAHQDAFGPHADFVRLK